MGLGIRATERGVNMRNIEYPFTLAKIRELEVGDTVNLSGRIFTGRDRLHKHLFESGKCPVDLKDGAIYHCGPVIVRQEGVWVVRAAGPTTSMRRRDRRDSHLRSGRADNVHGRTRSLERQDPSSGWWRRPTMTAP